uniref:hypothetical protein n=1 Tax=Klebsiella pneumoniae TaxID=573 RepID=UPI003F4E945A
MEYAYMKKKTYITAIALIVSSFSFSGQAFSANEPSSMLAKLSPENSGGTFKYSTDTNISSEQKKVYDTIIKYQTALNAGDTKTILGLFANESYSQWNDMLTADSTEKEKSSMTIFFNVKSLRQSLLLILSGLMVILL